ncbi:MAG: site-2 protease family protein [Bacteroidota bacterium]
MWRKVAVVLHELGHLIFAKLVGGTPRKMILGKGHKLLSTEAQGVKIIIHSKINSGRAYAGFDDLKYIRFKLIVYTAGGFTVNFILAGLSIFLIDQSISASEGFHIAGSFCLANFFTGFVSLIPYRIREHGIISLTDGLSLLKIPFYKKKDLLDLAHINELLDAYECYENKQYKKSINRYEAYKQKTENSTLVNINLSTSYLKLGEIERALELIEEILPKIDEEPFKSFRGYIYNELGWINLIVNKLEQADKYSSLAYKIDPNSEYFRGTRGSVLIAKGDLQTGILLITDDVDFNFPNNQTICAAIYLSLAYFRKGKSKKAQKYLRFASDNSALLDIDEMMLYDRVLEEIKTLKKSI